MTNLTMRKVAGVSLVLGLALLSLAGAAEASKVEQDVKREAPAAANPNAEAWPTPQLSSNTATGPEVPMARETNLPAARPVAPDAVEAPPASQSRNVVAVIVAILVLIGSRIALRRWRSRSDPS
jgi:hypothetical protein